MKKIKCIRIAIIALAVLAIGISGCSKSKDEGKTIGSDYTRESAISDTAIAAQELSGEARERNTRVVDTSLTGEMTYWTWDAAAPYYAEQFTKKFPNTKVTVNVYPDYGTKLAQALASGAEVPDVTMIENAFYGREANNPAMEDLGAAPYNALAMRDKFYEFWFDAGIGEDGKLRVVPNSPGMAGNFYRRDIAKELFGTDDPEAVGAKLTDWETVLQLGIQLKNKTNGKKFIIGDAGDVYGIMLAQTGVPYVENNTINTGIFLEPLRMARKFRQAGVDAKQGAWTPEWSAGMVNGEVLMYLSGSWGESYVLIANVQDTQDGLWGVTNMPYRNSNNGGNGFGIPKAAKNKTLAWEFIKFAITDLDMQADQLKLFACYPAFKEAVEDPYFSLPVPLFNGQKARMKYGELAATIVTPHLTAYDGTVGTIMGKYTQNVFNGEMEPEEAVALMKEEMISQFKNLH
jgi:multiple sugar transport system substrate-binding protein